MLHGQKEEVRTILWSSCHTQRLGLGTERLYLQHITRLVCKKSSHHTPSFPLSRSDKTPTGERSALSASVVSTRQNLRCERSAVAFFALFFLFFSRQECVVARSSAEVNRIVWSSGNSVSMTSSESSQEWKGGGGGEGGREEISSQGENGGIWKRSAGLGLFRWSKQRGGRPYAVWNIITQCAGDRARQRATAWFMLSNHLPGKAMEI